VKEDWHSLVPRLAAVRPVLVFDNRGIGGSDVPTAACTLADMADDTLALARHVGWPSYAVLGISMGGMIAQEVALRAPPGVVRRLILGCTTHGGTCQCPMAGASGCHTHTDTHTPSHTHTATHRVTWRRRMCVCALRVCRCVCLSVCVSLLAWAALLRSSATVGRAECGACGGRFSRSHFYSSRPPDRN
jgi:pimeloyl-ACP methyl ester carboxylesterase